MSEELNLPVTVGMMEDWVRYQPDPIMQVWTVSVQVRATQEFDNNDPPWTALVYDHAAEGNGSGDTPAEAMLNAFSYWLENERTTKAAITRPSR